MLRGGLVDSSSHSSDFEWCAPCSPDFLTPGSPELSESFPARMCRTEPLSSLHILVQKEGLMPSKDLFLTPECRMQQYSVLHSALTPTSSALLRRGVQKQVGHSPCSGGPGSSGNTVTKTWSTACSNEARGPGHTRSKGRWGGCHGGGDI